MTPLEFEALVKRLESFASSRPAAYRLRVALLAACGYGYIFGVLVLLALLLALLVTLVSSLPGVRLLIGKAGWAVLVLVLLVLRSLWVRFHPPEGLPLDRRTVEPLFEVIEALRGAQRAPKVHRVLLTDRFNASVVQQPRLGVFGWHRNYLLVGLPLLQALSPEQFCAVLAHELGHLSGSHGRLGAWIYRVDETWSRLIETLVQGRHWGARLFLPFFQWYVPFFHAYSFVLRRAQEHLADRYAAELVGAAEAGRALVALAVYAEFLEERFWPDLLGRADHRPDPPPAYSELALAFRAPLLAGEAQTWLQQALARPTAAYDTHPSLAERLSALAVEPRLPEPIAESAARRFLGSALGELTAQLDRAWQNAVAASWRERFEQAQAARAHLSALDDLARRQRLDREAAWQRAVLAERFRGEDGALPLYRAILADDPDHAGARFAIGRILLGRNDSRGVGAIERAMELDPEAVLPGCEQIAAFFARQGRESEARAYRERAQRQVEVVRLAQEERARLRYDDRYLSHDLDAGRLARLRQLLAGQRLVERAYLVRKEVQYFPGRPLYVLGVDLKTSWRGSAGRPDARRILDDARSELDLRGELVLVFFDEAGKRLRRAITSVPGAEVYRRDQTRPRAA